MNETAEISLHEEYMQAAFDEVLSAEANLAHVEGELSKAVGLLKTEKAIAEASVAKAYAALKVLMDETGESECLMPAENGTWNKIYYTTARFKVVVDEEAVPDEFCKIERKPKLKEIWEMLAGGDKKVNWAILEPGESKLAWRNVKKGAV